MSGGFIGLDALCAFCAYCVGLTIAWLYSQSSRKRGIVSAFVWGGIAGVLLVSNDYFYNRSPFSPQLLVWRAGLGAVFGTLGETTYCKWRKRQNVETQAEATK